MIGIHLENEFDGKTIIVWHSFPKTLEQGDQLVERLQREAKIPYADPGKPCLGGFWHQGAKLDSKGKSHEATLAAPPYSPKGRN